MPTPQGPRSQYALDGTVPNLTWDQFVQSFAPGAPGNTHNLYSSLGGLPAGRAAALQGSQNFGGGEMGSQSPDSIQWTTNPDGSPAYTYESGDLGDGTQNVYTQGANGSVMSQNSTIDNDSWWDSTGLPILASLAFSGGTAALGAAGIGVSGAGAGLANVGAGALGADGASAAFGGAGGAVSGAGSALGASANDLDLGQYYQQVAQNPADYATTNLTAAADPTTLTDAGGAGAGAATNAQPSFLQSIGNSIGDGVNSVENWYNDLNPLTRLGLSGVSSGVQGLTGDGSGGSLGNGITSDASGNLDFSNYTPTQIDTSGFNTAAANATDPNLPISGGGLVGSIQNLLNGSAGTSDYNTLLGAGGSILSGVLGSNAAKSAAASEVNAANNSNALAAAIYGNNTALNAPFTAAGYGALGQQSNLLGLNGSDAQSKAYGAFATSPNYAFALSQGTKAVNNSAAAAGGLYSGRAAKDLENYGQGLASQQYNTYFGNLGSLSSMGQASANQQAANGNNYVGNVSSNNNAAGNAAAAGTVGANNAWTNAFGQLLNQGSSNQILQMLLKGQNASNGYYATPAA